MNGYIHHITLNAGHVARVAEGEVSGETMARVRPWLSALVESGKHMPLPVAALADDYNAHATVEAGALVVTVSAPDGQPLVTMGVAVRSRHAPKLWDSLLAISGADEQERPPAPWCAVVLWPGLSAHLDAAAWLGDLERCIAWAWATREK